MQYGGGDIRQMLKDVGGSAYLVDFETFRRNVEHFQDAFRAIYPNTSLGYSYKTNYLPQLCTSADQMGLYAEVVSGAEYELARAYGVAGDRIIFNGPVKTETELEVALRSGAIVNIDCMEEVSKVCRVCEANAHSAYSVGLRCHLAGAGNRRSRFGFPADDGQLDAAFRRLNEIPNCTVSGLHCHSSADRSAQSYRRTCETMLNLADHLFTDAPPGFLDLGGGFCGPMPHSLAEQLGDSPDYRSYAEQIAPLFAKRYGHNGATQLILEPGVGILGDVMRFFCEVVAIKELPQRSVAVTTGSYQNIKPSISRVKLPMSVLPASDRGGDPIVRELDLVGYTCMEDDILHPDYKGPLEVGDVVMFENAGAYSIVFKAPFIRGMPAIVCRDHERGCWRVLHRPQPLAAWLTGYSQTGAAR